MNLRKRWNDMPLFWKVCGLIVFLLVFVVSLVETVLEPIMEDVLAGIYDEQEPWHEVVLWVISMVLPTLACGMVLSRMLWIKLDNMTRVTRAFGRGNLKARLPVTGNDKDAFDVLARGFNDMASDIENQVRSERKLLADISHELRSPLTRMAIATQLLQRKRCEEERVDLALRLEKEIEHMSEMVRQLLNQARGRFALHETQEAVDVAAILEELADDFAFQGSSQGKQVQSDVQQGLLVHGSPMLLQRMLGNLLSNALFYTPAGSTVEVTAAARAGDVVVTIRDHGPGVPQEQLEDIFRAFYRVDASRDRNSGGVGLGLALVHEAALLHGGTVRAENAQPGLRVIVTLPLHEQEQDIPAASE